VEASPQLTTTAARFMLGRMPNYNEARNLDDSHLKIRFAQRSDYIVSFLPENIRHYSVPNFWTRKATGI
jgi:hypothetical protein